jgi:hypothetical protein
MIAKLHDTPNDTNFIHLQQLGQDYLEAATALIRTWENPLKILHHLPITSLLGHSLELSLKGLISISRMTSGEGIPHSHDLIELAQALQTSAHLAFTDDEERALGILNQAYSSPYTVRYPRLGLNRFPNKDGLIVLQKLADRLSKELDTSVRAQNLDDPIVRQRLGAD